MTMDLQERLTIAGLALVIFLPRLVCWRAPAADRDWPPRGVHELLHMKGLKTMTIEGTLTLLATFALTIPLGNT